MTPALGLVPASGLKRDDSSLAHTLGWPCYAPNCGGTLKAMRWAMLGVELVVVGTEAHMTPGYS